MSHRPLPAMAGLLILAALDSSMALAGNNAGGQAFLSWDRAGSVSGLTEIPAAPFPLFLHLRDAPDVHALAARIIWTTNTEGAPPCYFLTSSPGPDSSTPQDSLFVWAVNAPPEQDFEGDSTYTWTIHFPAGSTQRDCVQYLVSAAACDSPASARFEPATVVVLDALGRADTLVSTGGAEIAPAPTMSLSISQVLPTELPSREATDLEIRGHGFSQGARVFLRHQGQ